jgi:uncharacterized protein DUF4340
MSRWKTILLCLIAIGAIGFLAIYEPLTRSTREDLAAERKGLVLDLDPSKVREIRVSTGVSKFDIKRVGNSWELGTKPKDRADAALVKQILTAAAGMQYFDRIEAKEFKSDSALSYYGLRNPKRSIEFNGDQGTTLFLGKDAASEDRIYVRVNKLRDVFLVSDELLKIAFRDASDFRDPRLSDLSPDEIDRFVIRRQGGEIELLRDATAWQIVKPLHALADESKVDDFLKRLLGQRIVEFVADDSGDLSLYGIAEGRDEITFYAEGSDRSQTVRLGTDKSGSVFGQFTARSSVYRLAPEILQLLQTSPETLRDRRLLPLNLDIVDLIRIRTPQREFSLRRQGDGWVVDDGGTERPASTGAIRALADAVATAQVSAYDTIDDRQLAAFGLDRPRFFISFVAVLSENTPETRAGEQVIANLAIGKSQDGDLLFARIGETPEVLSVPKAMLNAIPLDPAGWISPARP